ncbi:MAG: hypothetical protein U5J83_18315 [Bryobacterales bacterium]|nr:hypothetical protein [Bryobacterales bacterium]
MQSIRALWLSTALGVLIAAGAHLAGEHWPGRTAYPQAATVIRATHYTADVSAPDFWSRVNPSQAAKDFRKIREAGFNTVILIVSWTGFQPRLEAGSRSEEHYRLLDGLIAAADREGLDVLLRVGYAHDISNTPDKLHHERSPDLLRDPATRSAWLAYLRDVHEAASTHSNFRYGFLTWEDFFFFDYTTADEAARKAVAERLGYAEFLRRLPAAEYEAFYGDETMPGRAHPIPAANTRQIAAFSRFWDEWLLDVYAESRKAMPGLNMEVRVDCDPVPLPERFVCHERTFDLGGAPGATTIVYYTPAWGAENTGDLASAGDALGRFEYMLEGVRQHTKNPIFVDQFNFVDNTPGFERNTRIDPAQVGEFLRKAGQTIAAQTTGYALWTLWDVTANIAANGEFERGLDGWKTENATVMNSAENGKYLRLEPGGRLSYFVREGGRAGVPIRSDLKFTLAFRTHHAESEARFGVEVLDAQGRSAFRREGVAPDPVSGQVRVEGLPYFGGRETLRVENLGGRVVIDGILLFNGRQENGIYHTDGEPKEFASEVIALNRRLAEKSEAQPRYAAETAQSRFVNGVSPDGWVGERATFWLAKGEGPLELRVYVPETWRGYSAHLTTRVSGADDVRSKLQPGVNQIALPTPEDYPAFVTLECSSTVKAGRFTAGSADSRSLCFVLQDLGFARSPPVQSAPVAGSAADR